MHKINRDGFHHHFRRAGGDPRLGDRAGQHLEVPLADRNQRRRRASCLVYLAATLLVGLPVMIAETMLGRAARANAVTSFEILAPRGQWAWKAIGWMGFAAALLIMAFYSEVAGWVYAYIFKAVVGRSVDDRPEGGRRRLRQARLVAADRAGLAMGRAGADRRHHHVRRVEGHRGGDAAAGAAAVRPAAGAVRAQPDARRGGQGAGVSCFSPTSPRSRRRWR